MYDEISKQATYQKLKGKGECIMASIINKRAITYQLIDVLMERKEKQLEPLPLHDAYKILAARFDLSAEELGQANVSDQSNKWESEIRFVCTNLRKENIIKRIYAKLELTDNAYERFSQWYSNIKAAEEMRKKRSK